VAFHPFHPTRSHMTNYDLLLTNYELPATKPLFPVQRWRISTPCLFKPK
jgi:hypothetical protein